MQGSLSLLPDDLNETKPKYFNAPTLKIEEVGKAALLFVSDESFCMSASPLLLRPRSDATPPLWSPRPTQLVEILRRPWPSAHGTPTSPSAFRACSMTVKMVEGAGWKLQ